MSRASRPRRRRVHREDVPDPAASDAVAITAADRLDPRVWVMPDAPCNAWPPVTDPDLLLAWADERAPSLILSDEAAAHVARRRVDREDLAGMKPEERHRVLRERLRRARHGR
jgi:hypothetical protein